MYDQYAKSRNSDILKDDCFALKSRQLVSVVGKKTYLSWYHLDCFVRTWIHKVSIFN